MELKDEQKIIAPREEVYAALNDPEILQKCIPGCEVLEKISDTEMTAIIILKIGPLKVKMKGVVELSNLKPPESYTITGEGKGGPSGFAKGGADIDLVEETDGTLLKYNVKIDIGGKIAQLGTRLIDSTAQKLARQFFDKFNELLSTAVKDVNTAAPETSLLSDSYSQPESNSKNRLWIYVCAVVLIIAGYAVFINT
ncbi:carbon monoxide dehydrogenase subunit G [Kiloniella sp. EL199]|uniref:SRPBCC family protein n=1 Tax=Kiloniella sp. EL199 TaxID=2107581 RepID=UPI000EA3D4BC|nr:carbon monoxide dehydrogenase subunit G [Kiloniella sp. EL199]